MKRACLALALAVAACSGAPPPRAVERVRLPPPEAPRAVAAPVRPPAAALEPIALHPVPLDVESLPALSQKWSHPASAWALARDAGLLLVIEPSGRAIAALDVETGRARWTRHAPGREHFTDAAVVRGAPLLVRPSPRTGAPSLRARHSLRSLLYPLTSSRAARIVSGNRAVVVERVAKKYFVARVRLRDGRLGPRTRLPASAALSTGERGGLALVDRVACRARLWNPETGRWAGPALSGSVVQLKDFRGRLAPTCRMTVAVHALAGGVSVASTLDAGRAVLAGFDASGEKWRLPLGGDVVKSLLFAGGAGVFAGLGIVQAHTSLARVDLASGRVAWRRDFTRCATQDASAVRLISPNSILIDECGALQTFDATSGARVWRRDVIGTPVVIGEAPSWIHVFKDRPPRVQWLDENGKPAGRVALPAGIARIEPLAGGLLVVSAKRDVVALLGRDGKPRWQYRVEPGRVRVAKGRVIVLGAHAVTILDSKTGRAETAPLASPWLVGRATGSSPWLFAASSPLRVTAFE